jgi:hypothetical protein
MSKEAVKSLKAARKLLSKPGVWIKGWLARDSVGQDVPITDPSAVRFCSLGAVRHVDGPGEHQAFLALRMAASQILGLPFNENMVYIIGNGRITKINDRSRDIKPVLKMFDRAIAIAKKL